MVITQEKGKWHLYSKDGSKHLGGPYDSKEEAEERERQVNYHKSQKADLIEVSLIITKANLKDGVMRWQAVTSDTLPDSTGESTSLALFQDWVERIETGKSVEWLPPPRKPFLGISHYPDLDGYGEAGLAEKNYVDGNRFRASGIFKQDTPLGSAVFQTLRSELDQPVDNPVRISAAWWDIAHSHGSFVFERKSLTDVCPMCQQGIGNKVYLRGQLDHYATTRVPINSRTSLALTERSMTTRKQDASTIVGEELAEELEAKSQLVGKADVESPAIVIKAAKKPPVEEEAAKEGEEDSEGRVEEEKGKKKPKGGSFLTDKAYTWQAAKTLPEAKSFSRVELMGLVRRNLTEVPEGERLVMLEALLDDINTELTEIKTAVEDLYFTQPATDEPLVEPSREEEPTMTYLEEFTQEVTEALESSEPTAKKAEVIQKSLANVALRLRAELESPANGGDMVAILRAANAPLVDAIAQLTARMGVQQPIILPTQKGVTAPVVNPLQPATQLPVSPVTGQPSSLTEMVRRSVGL
jgi:hypothetical protein